MLSHSYTLRLRIVVFLGTVFWLVLAGRLLYVQVWDRGKYTLQAREQHKRKILLEAKRGRILDRNGVSLVVNLRAPSFAANPSQVRDPQKAAQQFSLATGQSQSLVLRQLTSGRSFVWLVRKVDREAAKKIRSQKLPGIREILETKRCFSLGTLAGQLIGYTDIDNIGIEGVELAFEDYLNGRSGWRITSIDAHGRILPNVGDSLENPESGADVILTIDAIYQGIVEEELKAAVARFKAQSGMAILMNPKTGEILSMANVPLYDPNRLGRYDPQYRRNRTITDLYEPGSTFKIVAASAALERGLKKPDDLIFCENGRMVVPGGVIRDAHEYGWLTFREVVEQSSNIGIVKVARSVGEKWFYQYAKLLGFGSKTGVDLPGEARGLLRHPSTWSARSLDTIAIGQEVSATALQIANAYCAIANGGLLMRPRILRAIIGEDGKVLRRTKPEVIRRAISEETSRTMVDFLRGAVERGTGIKARIDGFDIAGKTGTAQKVREDGKGYAPGQYISSFVGFLPASDPRLLCLIVVDTPRGIHWGSEVAAPTFKRIIGRILSLKHPPIMS